MEIIIAKNAGFCFGVKRAVKITEDILEEKKDDEKVYSLGPLIHNPQFVESLKDKGLIVIDDFRKIEEGKLIIRSHGIPLDLQKSIENTNIQLIDTTCPLVKNVQKRVENYYNQGYQILIIGDKDHPEVIGINGYCDYRAIILNNIVDANKVKNYNKMCVVSQTTNRKELFEDIVEVLKKNNDNVEIFNTICNATSVRQNSAEKLSKEVDAMIIIGGFNSSNTNKLVEVSRKFCNKVYHIETIKDLPLQDVIKFNTIGITAGASTPDWIIEEVVRTMEEYNNNDLIEAIESSMRKVFPGDVIKGKVIYVTNNEVMVNINYKSDGIITREELSTEDNVNLKDMFKESDEIEVYVVKLDDGEGNVVLSVKRLDAIKNWEKLVSVYENKEKITCKIISEVKGGLIAELLGIQGFIPASLISTSYVKDLSKYIGTNLEVKVIDLDKKKKRVILSGKEVELEIKEAKAEEFWKSVEIDKIIEGRVARLTNFGAFIDLGGVDGLIHISDLSWSKIKHPSEVLKIGDTISVKVLNFNKEKGRISLGFKQTLPKPWEIFIDNNKVNDIVEGRVVSLLDFGAFIRLKEGVEGLAHISQISKERIEKPSDVLKIGETIDVKILDINEEEEKISLSIKDVVIEEEENDEVVNEEDKIENEEMIITLQDFVDEDNE